MNSLFRIMAVAGLAVLAACTSVTGVKGGDRSLVDPSQPHAILMTGEAPAGASYYQVRIVWLDGDYLSTGPERNAFWVAPGTHEIGFTAIINSDAGPTVMSTPSTSAPENMPTLTLDVKQGYTYYFAAEIPETGMANQWKPVLVRTTQDND